MKININNYRSSKPLLHRYIDMFPNTSKGRLMAEFSAIRGLPLIICYYFLGEIVGFTDEIRDKINEYKKYYKIENMEGETYE